MDQIKISLLEEKPVVEGVEMIPIQIGDLNYKVSVDTIVNRSKEILHAYQQYTYDELKQLKDSSLLIPGEHYLLTDYQCIYKQPVSEEVITCDFDGWQLMLLATSENIFSNDAHVFFTEDSTYIAKGGNPIIECKYIFDDFSEYTWSDASSKGVIVDLKDSNNNRCNYDFKHIKFRRWALKDVTENNTVGAANQPSAYRCYGTAEEPKRSDGRSWVGSGLEIEKDYIASIFAGTFNSVMWGEEPLHDDYITKVHKPFKNIEVKNQYVAYNTTLDDIALSSDAKPGLAKFEIDSNDYIDCYTFECDGDDISNYTNIFNNSISCNSKVQLPNVVILFASDTKQNVSGNVWNNELNAKNVTFSLHSIGEYYPIFNRVTSEDLRSSIFNCFRVYQTDFEDYCAANYVSGSLYDCTLEGMTNSVLFGYYSAVRFGSCTYNLLFGNEQMICKSANSWVSPADGNYWYNDVTLEWFGYNIMAPFQYSVFYPHTNTNTVKLPYNKGVTLLGTFQDNFVDRMRWGVVVHYGAIQGNYIGQLNRCVISPASFTSQVAHSSGASSIYTLEGATKLTSIYNTDITGWQINVKTLMNNLTEDQLNKLKENGIRKILFVENSVPYIKYYSEIASSNGGSGSIDLSNYYNKTEIDELLSQVTVDLSDYYNKALIDEIVSNIQVDLTGYATEEWVENKGYLTEHQDLSDYALKTDIPDVSGKLDSSVAATTYSTKDELTAHATEAREYTDKVIDDLVGLAPDALNTIYELAEAIENNVDVLDALNSAITNKLDKSEASSTYATKDELTASVSNAMYIDSQSDSIYIRTDQGEQTTLGTLMTSNSTVNYIVTMTKSEYEALETKAPKTLYLITEE